MCKGNKKHCLDAMKIVESYTHILCSRLLGLYVFAGCDSVIVSKETKVEAIKIIEKNKKFHETSDLDDSCETSREIMDVMNEFTYVLYWKPCVSKIMKLGNSTCKPNVV